MYTIECIPPIDAVIQYRFSTEAEAITAARGIAEKHRVQVNINKTILRFIIKVSEERVD